MYFSVTRPRQPWIRAAPQELSKVPISLLFLLLGNFGLDPGQAVISQITQVPVQAAHLEFDAPHATSFDVYQKLQADPDITKIAGRHH